MKVVRSSAPRTGRLYPQEMFLVFIFTRGWVYPRFGNPVTPPGIDPGTVRPVAQRLIHYGTPGPFWRIVVPSYSGASRLENIRISHEVVFVHKVLLIWKIWRAPNNASKWQMRFNPAFKGLIKIRVFWNVMSCRWASNNGRFVDRSVLSSWTAWLRTWKHYELPKRRDLLPQIHCVASQNISIFYAPNMTNLGVV
jgi:hypothetical protein